MAHKVHPKAFRIKRNKDWNSRWISKEKFAEYMKQDYQIRQFLKEKLKEGGVEKIEIERFPGKLNILIWSSRPGLIIGRRGKGIEKVTSKLKKKLSGSDQERKLNVEIKSIKDPWLSASLAAQMIAQRIEKRTPYRRCLKQAMGKIMGHKKEVKGARIEVSGRLNGLEMARREWMMEGKLPLQTLRSDIDYGFAEAVCTYGVIGVKVWINKGEKLE